MEIVGKSIYQEENKGRNSLFITLDEDFNVPDQKPDVDSLLRQLGDVKLELVRAEDGKASVAGKMEFMVMYQGSKLDNLTGSIDFNEKINMDGLTPDIKPECYVSLEDLTVKLIHSRKINVKAVVELMLVWDEISNVSVGSVVEDAGSQVQILAADKEAVQIKVCMSDSLRVKQDIVLPGGKPDIGRILWKEIALCGMEERLQEDSIKVSGELKSFIIYESGNEDSTISWFEAITPFEENVAVSGCNPDMVGLVTPKIRSFNLDVRQDSDGEARIFGLECVIDLKIKAYEEISFPVIKDLYIPMKNVEPVSSPVKLKQLAMKNSARTRVTSRSRINSPSTIMSVCNVGGKVRLQMTGPVNEGIEVNGMIDAQVFFITDNDAMPWESMQITFPFTHIIESRNLGDKTVFQVDARLEDITCVMVGNDEVEFKCLVGLETICFDEYEMQSMTDVKVSDMDDREYMAIPGFTGYVVGGGETLWDIAKANHTTCEHIRTLNKMSTDRVAPGDKLLLIKELR